MGQIMYGTADSKLWRKFWTDLPTVDQVNPNFIQQFTFGPKFTFNYNDLGVYIHE